MGRAPCCDKNGLKKGPWTPEEDQKLIDYIQKHGYGNWRNLPKNAGLQRCGKSCRLRWTNYLRPDIKRGRFSFEEEETIIQLHSILGNKWSAIAARLPGRTDNEIKNYWNTHIRKRLLRMGLDPVTHSPRLDLLDLSSIFGNSHFYNNSSASSQMNLSRLLGLQPMVNPELLKLATSLLSTQHQNINSSSNPQMHNGYNSIVQSTQIQAPIRTPIPSCTTITTTTPTAPTTALPIENGNNINCETIFDEAQLMENNFEQYSSRIQNFGDQSFEDWQMHGFPSSQSLVNIIEPSTLEYYDSDQGFINPSLSDMSGQQSYMSFGSSLMSTPTSSSTPYSNSTNYCGSGTEDERESDSSEMIKFEMPDFLDFNQFLFSQTTCSSLN